MEHAVTFYNWKSFFVMTERVKYRKKVPSGTGTVIDSNVNGTQPYLDSINNSINNPVSYKITFPYNKTAFSITLCYRREHIFSWIKVAVLWLMQWTETRQNKNAKELYIEATKLLG